MHTAHCCCLSVAVLTSPVCFVLQVGFRHTGFLRPGGALVMKVYEVRTLRLLLRPCCCCCRCSHWLRSQASFFSAPGSLQTPAPLACP